LAFLLLQVIHLANFSVLPEENEALPMFVREGWAPGMLIVKLRAIWLRIHC